MKSPVRPWNNTESVSQHLLHPLDNLRRLGHHVLGEAFHFIAADRLEFVTPFFGFHFQLGILECALERAAKNFEPVGWYACGSHHGTAKNAAGKNYGWSWQGHSVR